MCSPHKIIGTTYRNSLIKGHPSPVYDSLLGNAMTNKNLMVLENHCIIMRRDHKIMRGRVKLIGGGGAGTEPSEAYYVGRGMLTAAVLGEVFRAPSANEILLAIRELAVDSPEGILLLVKNYAGDRLNFTIAMDQALKENITIKMILIQDHVFNHPQARQGRQGMAGCSLVYKIVGEMAEQGKLLEEIVEECEEYVLNDLATVGVTLGGCNTLNLNILKRLISPDEIIFGLGIYGKGGVKKIKMTTLEEIVSIILGEIISYFNSISSSSKLIQYNIAVLVNNLGATTKLEEAVVAKEVTTQLNRLGYKILKLFTGTFMTSMASQGFSISILKMNSPDIIKYLNASTTAPGWPGSYFEEIPDFQGPDLPITVLPAFSDDFLHFADLESICSQISVISLSEKASAALKQITIFAAEALISCEKQLNLIDSETGDGDTGSVLRRGAEGVKKAVLNDEMDLKNPTNFFNELSELCCKHMGGLSGILYCIFFKAAGRAFYNASEFTAELCCMAFKESVKAVKHYGNVELGERTMLDALIPAAESFESALKGGRNLLEAFYAAATTCEFKAEETKHWTTHSLPFMSSAKKLMYPDAGAHATSIWLRAITFDKETPYKRPGIILWGFLTEDEANYVMQSELTTPELMSFIDKKIGNEQPLLGSLLHQTIKFCRKHYKRNLALTSALVGSVYYTHRYFTASRWRTAAEVYFYFRECILRQSVESPPTSIEIFGPEEAKNALIFFIETYLRNLPLISILHLPHYKLQLKLKQSKMFSDLKLLIREK